MKVINCFDSENCDTFFKRANGELLCNICGDKFRNHPYCGNSEIPESMKSTTLFNEYYLHILCDGRHVKL